MSRVTAQDTAFAECLLDAAEAYVTDAASRPTAVRTIARLLTDYRDVVIACAVTEVERRYAVRERKPGACPMSIRCVAGAPTCPACVARAKTSPSNGETKEGT